MGDIVDLLGGVGGLLVSLGATVLLIKLGSFVETFGDVLKK